MSPKRLFVSIAARQDTAFVLRARRGIHAAILFFIVIAYSHAQTSVDSEGRFTPIFMYPGNFQTRTVYNLSIRENNRFIAHMVREVRERYSLVAQTEDEKKFAGTAFIFETRQRGGVPVARRIENIVNGSFTVDLHGGVERADNSYFPLRVGFPVFPKMQGVRPGERWIAEGELFVDPLRTGHFTRLNIIAEYTYTGITHFQGIEVHAITAQYALRYRMGDDPYGDENLQSVSGTHRITIYLRTEDARPFFIQNNITETYTFEGLTISKQGFSHTWYTDVTPMRRDVVKRGLMDSIIESTLDNEDFEITEREIGVSLTTSNIHFVPDSAELLPGENQKIEVIAAILRRVPDRTFLVVGHTADVGTRESQMTLSVQRAESIARLLTQSGISAERILFTGKGGTEPAADNSIEEGRARNRRVEIIILED
ncbi:MAG: OmpA family protein [Spirochaetes bacterium]|nr:OmpA family protein [Spirochaetota bacterium]